MISGVFILVFIYCQSLKILSIAIIVRHRGMSTLIHPKNKIPILLTALISKMQQYNKIKSTAASLKYMKIYSVKLYFCNYK